MSQLGSTECRSNLDSSDRQPYCRCPTPMCAACTARMAHRQSHSKTRLVPRRARSANQFATSGCMRHVGLRRWDPRKSRPKRCKCRPRRGTPRHQQSRPGPTTSILRLFSGISSPTIHSSHTEPKLHKFHHDGVNEHVESKQKHAGPRKSSVARLYTFFIIPAQIWLAADLDFVPAHISRSDTSPRCSAAAAHPTSPARDRGCRGWFPCVAAWSPMCTRAAAPRRRKRAAGQ